MTPDERQLLSGLFDRIRNASAQPRDHEAEAFIADAVRNQPYSPYLLAQTVIVQDQALRAANDRLQQLEEQVKQLQGAASQPQETSFLGSIGKSIFGSGQPIAQQGAPRASVPTTGGFAPASSPQEPGPYASQQSMPGGPWGQQQQSGGFATGAPPQQGGGFLKGALGAAAGVAGGVLLADSISGLFGGHHNPFGIASGGGFGGGGGFGNPGGETVVNNYYGGGQPGADALDPNSSAADAQQDFLQDQSDDFGSDNVDPGSSGDGGYDV